MLTSRSLFVLGRCRWKDFQSDREEAAEKIGKRFWEELERRFVAGPMSVDLRAAVVSAIRCLSVRRLLFVCWGKRREDRV